MKQQRGFTLIELVMVIVILGILAAVALPRFVDLQGGAADGSAQGFAGALSSANAINYGASVAGAPGATAITSGTTTCGALAGLLTTPMPAPVQFVNAAAVITCPVPVAGNNVQACNVRHTGGNTAAGFPVTVICTN